MIAPVPGHCILVTFTEISGREIKVAEIVSCPFSAKEYAGSKVRIHKLLAQRLYNFFMLNSAEYEI